MAGLKSYLQIEYDNLYIIDIVCHGTVSPKIFADHIMMLEKMYGKKVTGYNNRSKIDGWGTHTELVRYEDGVEKHKSLFIQAYKNIFYSHNALRPSCYQCAFCNLQRVGDLTICDMWGIEGCLPEFKDTLGVSLILVNNEHGVGLFKSTDVLKMKQPQTKTWVQPNMQYPSVKGCQYNEFWNYYLTFGYEKTIKKYAGCNYYCRFRRFVKLVLVKLHLYE